MEEKLYTDIDYSFLSKQSIKELEILFANSDLTREQRNKFVELLGKTYDQGHIDCNSEN